MSQPSPDARHLARAVDALTTQVRRIADAVSTPVAIVSDAPTTTADDTQRTARRASLRVILDRASRGSILRTDEAALLRQHVDAEQREVDTARAELEQAQAAIDRVRALHRPQPYRDEQTICTSCSAYDPSTDSCDSPPMPYEQCPNLLALDGTEQPTTR